MLLFNQVFENHLLSMHANSIEELILWAEGLNESFINSIHEDDEGSFISVFKNPTEVHPYLEFRKLMKEKPTGFIIGTFPPASYLRYQLINDQVIGNRNFKVDSIEVSEAPRLSFFHGNKNSMWEYLNISDFSINAIIDFLNRNDWVYSDIIYSCCRTKITEVEDKNLKNIIPNFPLIDEIIESKDGTSLWFNTSSIYNSKGLNIYKTKYPNKVNCKDVQAYDIFLRVLQELGYEISLRLNELDQWIEVKLENHAVIAHKFRFLLHHQLKINNKHFNVFTSPSPSNSASQSFPSNKIYKNWISGKVKNKITPKKPTMDFRKEVFSAIVNRDIEKLNKLQE